MTLKRATGGDLSAVRARPPPSDMAAFEQSLRPRTLTDYVGQSKVKGHLLMHMQAARERREPLGHTLLHGPPGLG